MLCSVSQTRWDQSTAPGISVMYSLSIGREAVCASVTSHHRAGPGRTNPGVMSPVVDPFGRMFIYICLLVLQVEFEGDPHRLFLSVNQDGLICPIHPHQSDQCPRQLVVYFRRVGLARRRLWQSRVDEVFLPRRPFAQDQQCLDSADCPRRRPGHLSSWSEQRVLPMEARPGHTLPW